MAKAELGNLTARYCPPSAANVNCENPRRKPVSHLPGPNWAERSGFSDLQDAISSALHRCSTSFTGCTQKIPDSGLQKRSPPVQSQIRGWCRGGRLRPPRDPEHSEGERPEKLPMLKNLNSGMRMPS